MFEFRTQRRDFRIGDVASRLGGLAASRAAIPSIASCTNENLIADAIDVKGARFDLFVKIPSWFPSGTMLRARPGVGRTAHDERGAVSMDDT